MQERIDKLLSVASLCMVWFLVGIAFGICISPTVEQCEPIINQNPEMCLSVCVDEFEKWGC